MKKILFLIVLLFSASFPVEATVDDVEPLEWDERHVQELKKSGIPVYVPTRAASSNTSKKLGHLFVSKLETTKDHYIFQISRQRVSDGKSLMLTFDEMTMSAGQLPSYRKQPFATFEIFEKPEGTLIFHDNKIDYFNNKRVFIWKNDDWEYLVWAENPNNAVNIVKRVMASSPKGCNPVKGSIRGQMSVIETREGVRADAGWTYDNGKTWYILTGKFTPEQLVEVLRTLKKMN